MSNIEEVIEQAPKNNEIIKSFLVADNKLKGCKKAVCSISGGADSDIVLDLLTKIDSEHKITYVFFDTGLEYEATKKHLDKLKAKYGIEIYTAKAVKPIPVCCHEHGVPFLSKYVSERISRLQRHGFKWEDKPFTELLEMYPKCESSLKWWCNGFGEKSRFNISYNKWLKEFLIENPPSMPISNKCCHYAKKLVAANYKKQGGYDLDITGIRKSEGGIRSAAYKNCFTPAKDNTIDEFRPIFWYTTETKKEYDGFYGVEHSDCYEIWGLPRTGCAGCPYAKDFERELEAVMKNEPKMYKALIKVFGASYEYIRKYREFQKKMNGKG